MITRAINHLFSHFERGNKAQRHIQRIEAKADYIFRDVCGYHLEVSGRLSPSQLAYVFLPDSQTASEAWAKLRSLNKNMQYSLIVLWLWAGESGKHIDFTVFPQFA